MTGKFKPAWWLPGAHAQTLWPYLFRRLPAIDLDYERLELPDGDFVDLSWGQNQSGPVIAVFHGLEGSIHSPYASTIMATIQNNGWRGVFMHFRGCSGEHNRLARSYHSGDTGDIEYLIATLRQRFPDTPIAAIGYSLGGNALLKYLGETDRQGQLAAAIAVSVPFLLADGARRLEQGFSRFYQWFLLRRLQEKMQSKFTTRDAPVPMNNIAKLDTFYKFDNQITAPLHGFKNAKDYYNRCSSRRFLKNINIPTLILHARDDPFMTPQTIPESHELSKHVQLEVYEGGGHVGFISGGVPWRPVYWLEERIPEFISSVINNR